MKDQIEQLAREEKELEEKMFGTPEAEVTTKAPATEPEVVQEAAPVKVEELVTPTPKPATDELPPVQTEDWEKRYKNLRGSRDQKLYEAKSQLSAALQTINTLQAKLEEMRTAAPKVDPLEGVFTEEDTENLGEATVDAMRKVTKKATEAATAPLQAQLEEERRLRQEQSELQAQNVKQEAYNIFLGRIQQAVPEWETINYDPGFMSFMDEADVDGVPRKAYFAQAEAQGNSATIIKYMKEYQATQQKAADPLADKITPTGEAAGATQVADKKEPEVVTQAEINQFYDDLARGKYQGRHSEAQAIEAEIDKATMEGRVVL